MIWYLRSLYISKEGFDDLQSLTLLTTEEIDELATTIGMKQGHKKKFPVLIQEEEQERRREKEKQRREDTREEEELEEERRREKEELEEERRREKEELEEERLRGKEERQRAKELATLEADRILAKARGTHQLGGTEEGKVSTRSPSNLKSKPEQGGLKPATITAETKSKTQLNLLPPHKLFGAFISHKKASCLCLSLQSIAFHLIVLFRHTLNSAATLSPFRFV